MSKQLVWVGKDGEFMKAKDSFTKVAKTKIRSHLVSGESHVRIGIFAIVTGFTPTLAHDLIAAPIYEGEEVPRPQKDDPYYESHGKMRLRICDMIESFLDMIDHPLDKEIRQEIKKERTYYSGL